MGKCDQDLTLVTLNLDLDLCGRVKSLEACSISTMYHKPCPRLSVVRNRELNLIHLNNHKAIVQASCMENMQLPDKFMSTALRGPSGIA